MNEVSEIKSRLSIEEVVSDYVKLIPAGKFFRGICPFHNDTKPSLLVNPERQIAWCFACNSGGDIFSFVQKIENCEFPEAVKILAEKAGVKISEFKKKSSKEQKKEEKYREILKTAVKFFQDSLLKNKKVQEILSLRKISTEVLSKFEIGFAEKSENNLQNYLISKGFSHREILEIGLLVPKNSAESRDKFRGRIMFPIRDFSGEICGFSGRKIDKNSPAPKYLNSPESPIFQKSKILFALNFAKNKIKKEDFTILVEGFFDVISCHFAGIENTVGICGTAFSKFHAQKLKRFSKKVSFAFDADLAGIEATLRAAKIAIENNLEVFVISIPQGKDPDDAVREDLLNFKLSIQNRQPVIEFFLDFFSKDRDCKKNLSDKKIILEKILPLLKVIKNEVEKDFYLKKLAEKIDVRYEVLEKEISRNEKSTFFKKENKSEENSAKISSLKYFLAILLSFPDFFKIAEEKFLIDLLPECEEKKFYKKLKKKYNPEGGFVPEDIFEKNDSIFRDYWQALATFAENQIGNFSKDLQKKEFISVLQKVNRDLLEKKQFQLAQKLKNSENVDPEDLIKINEITKLLKIFHQKNG